MELSNVWQIVNQAWLEVRYGKSKDKFCKGNENVDDDDFALVS